MKSLARPVKPPLTHQHIAEVTWTGLFPLALMVERRAFPADEPSSGAIRDSLMPYVGERERTVRLTLYARDDKRVLDLQAGLSVYVHSAWKPEKWREAGATITVTDAAPMTQKRRWLHRGVVTFRSDFPLDMLRYDCCTLEDSGAASTLVVNSFDPDHRGPFTVVVLKWTDEKRSPWPSHANDRWRAYNADVVPATEYGATV